MFQHELKGLAEQFSALEALAHQEPGQAREVLPVMLKELQRSLEALGTAVAERPVSEGSESQASARDTMDAWPGRDLRFRAMAERGPVLVRIMSTATRCRWVNPAWLEFTGRSMTQLIGEGWLQAVHPEDRDRCANVCHESVESSRLDRVEYRLQRKNGTYGWILEIALPRLNSRKSVGGYLGTAIEITGHRRAMTYLALQYSIAHVLAMAESPTDTGALVLQLLSERLDWEVGEYWLVDGLEREPRCIHVWASASVDASSLHEGLRTRAFPAGAGPPWQSGKPAWIEDIGADDALAREPEARRVGLRGMLRVPVMVHGEVYAILRFFCRETRAPDDSQLEFMLAVSVQLGQVLERQRSVERIRESEARKAAILEASLDAVITIDYQRRVIEFNSAAETIFGYRRHDAVGHDLATLIVPPRLREQALAGYTDFLVSDQSKLLSKRFDSIAMRSNGSEFPVEVAVASIRNGDQPMLTVFLCDTTASKLAEQELKSYQEHLRSLMSELLVAEEGERRRLAIDLHDGLSQTIALAQIKLSTLRFSVSKSLTGTVDEIAALITQANQAARSISFELSPPVLHDLGLEPAVQWLIENIQARYGIEIVLEIDSQPKPTDEKTRVILFRSLRELLINAAKHAGARQVRVYLGRDEDRLNASVEDDGIGMEPAVVNGKGLGLSSIRERLSHVGGSMQLESTPGRGTKVRLCAPLTGSTPTKVRA